MSKKQQIFKQVNNKKAAQTARVANTPKTSNGAIVQEGVIVENCGNTQFKVALDINPDITVYGTISGKMRMHYIKVGVGDSVQVEMSPYDLTKCRITRRLMK